MGKKVLLATALFGFILIPWFSRTAQAASCFNLVGATDPLSSTDDSGHTDCRFGSIADVAAVLLNLVFGAGLALTLILMIMAGIKYVTSQGDPKAIMEARNALTYAIVGFVVVISAFVIRFVVLNALGGPGISITNVTP